MTKNSIKTPILMFDRNVLLNSYSLATETVVVLLHTVPVLYDKYEDKIDPLAEKATIQIKKQYAVFDAKVLSKIPKGLLKHKKNA